MRLRIFLLAVFMFVGAIAGAHAQTYKWVDDKGVTHYGDRIPPEYVKKGNVQLNKQGTVIRKTDPALTPEQRRAQQEEAEKLKEALRAAEAQQREDIALLNTYVTEKEIDAARDRRLAQVDQIITQARYQLDDLGKRAAAEELTLKRAVSANAKGNSQIELDRIIGRRTAMQAAIEKLLADRQGVVAQFEQDKLRYREVKANGVTSTQLGAVARRAGDGRVSELSLAPNDALVTECVEQWRDTVSKIGAPYAVAARLIVRNDRQELAVEGRARSATTGQNAVRRWTCVLTADRKIHVKETAIRKALASIGANY